MSMYAVIETGGKQYRVAPGDTLDVERLEVEAGGTDTFDRVLLVANEGKVSVGNPTVSAASVLVDVTNHLRGEKKVAFKMKRRKGYHRTVGHRPAVTRGKAKEITGGKGQGKAQSAKEAGAQEKYQKQFLNLHSTKLELS